MPSLAKGPPVKKAALLVTLLAWTYLLALLWLGPFRDLDTSDVIIPIFCSVERWTPFFYGQNRFGMLWPGLCSWLKDPLANLYLQQLLTSLCALAPFWLLPRAFNAPRPWVWTQAMCLAFLATCKLHVWWMLQTTMQPYGTSLTFGLLGIWALRNRRMATAFLCYALAFWVNIGAGPLFLLLAIPLIGERYLTHRRVRDCWPLAVLMLEFVVAVIAPNFLAFGPSEQTAIRIPNWAILVRLLSSLTVQLNLWALLTLLVLFLMGCRRPGRAFQWTALQLSLALFLMFAQFILMKWVEVNGFDSRYFNHGYFFLVALGTSPAAFLAWSPTRTTSLGLGCLLGATLLAQAQLPIATPQTHFGRLKERWNSLLQEGRALGVEVWAGDFWPCWSLAFIDRVERYPSRSSPPLSERCLEVRSAWIPVLQSGGRVGLISENPQDWFYNWVWQYFPAEEKWVTLRRSQSLSILQLSQPSKALPPPEAALPYPKGAVLLATDPRLRDLVGFGWTFQEGQEACTLSRHAELLFSGAPAEVELSLRALPKFPMPQVCQLSVNDQSRQTLTWKKAETKTVRVRLPKDEVIRIAFDLPLAVGSREPGTHPGFARSIQLLQMREIPSQQDGNRTLSTSP